MLFNSFNFLIFFPLVIMVYFVVPRKLRMIWLLICSYYFYMSWNVKYGLIMGFSTLVTYLCGILLGKCQKIRGANVGKKKLIVAVGFIINLGILGFFKYFDFMLNNLNMFLGKLGIQMIEKPFDIILPVGISFYMFQSLGYIVDVYREKVEPERNIGKYALFVSFFPLSTSGPIERSTNLLEQIREMDKKKLFDYRSICSGLIVMLYGYFLKMVLADRIAILVDTVYNTYYFCGTIELVAAAMAYSIQIYCDFASYSLMALGAARILGFEVMENFNTPYFSRSIKEFWRRWHISLSTWFRDYLYIPLGGNRCGKMRKNVNLMITFLVSGLWHGASWSFIAWGGIHGVYQIIGAETKNIREQINTKLNVKTESLSYRMGQMFITFLLTTLAWIFFRAGSLRLACEYIKRMFTKWNPWALFDGSIYTLGLDRVEMNILLFALVVMFLISLIKYKKNENLDVFLAGQCIWFRWGVILMLFSFIFLFGIYGPGFDAGQFIYSQF